MLFIKKRKEPCCPSTFLEGGRGGGSQQEDLLHGSDLLRYGEGSQNYLNYFGQYCGSRKGCRLKSFKEHSKFCLYDA